MTFYIGKWVSKSNFKWGGESCLLSPIWSGTIKLKTERKRKI